MVWPGEKEAWDLLSGLDAKNVSVNTNALFDSSDASYLLTCFGQKIHVSLRDRRIFGGSSLGAFLVTSLGDFSRLSILRYLIHARDLPPSGRLVRPSDLPGGEIFAKGTHVLPLEMVAGYFSNHAEEFLKAGRSLGGDQSEYGDLSLKIHPFPRVPVVLILWFGDEEFPSTASLLFDSSCILHLPPDVVWSTSMLTLEMMMGTKAQTA